MNGVKLVLEGPTLLAVVLTQAVMAFVLGGYAVAGVIDARRRWAQRERELFALEAFHSLRFPRAPAAKSATNAQ